MNDKRPDAWARLIDRLLASPHYGERWGRHWLDLVRYADSNGADENKTHGNAWRYRDYIIASFNADKPFNRLILEQIAGDLLPDPGNVKERNDQLIATGFLLLGPKMLAEQDKAKLVIDVVDEQIDTISKTFLAQTLACARCHDHKFDPFTAADYYGIAGILKSTKSFASLGHVAAWNERALQRVETSIQKAERDKASAQLAEAEKRIKVVKKTFGKLKNKKGDEAKKTRRRTKAVGQDHRGVTEKAPRHPQGDGCCRGETCRFTDSSSWQPSESRQGENATPNPEVVREHSRNRKDRFENVRPSRFGALAGRPKESLERRA